MSNENDDITMQDNQPDNDVEMTDSDPDLELNCDEDTIKSLIENFSQIGIKPELSYSKNEKGTISLKTVSIYNEIHFKTGCYLLDFFAKCGSMRGNANELKALFLRALAENPSYALKCVFYMRDVRGGQGERQSFRELMRLLALSPKLNKFAIRNMKLIPEFGRYDDLVYCFESTPLQNFCMKIIKQQLEEDLKTDRPSLLGKWLPSENASSKNTKRLASVVMKELEYPPKKYRKTLSSLRKKIKIVERKMSGKKWERIQFDKVPGLAFKKYNKAFAKHQPERYKKFLEDVKKGKKTIKTATLYPYDLVRKFMYPKEPLTESEIETMNVMWDKLPDYLPKGENDIVVVDTSGSMTHGAASVPPLCVAISLGIYIGERLPLNGFITFSEDPQFCHIQGKTLQQKINNMKTAHWGMNTNLQKVFDLVLTMQRKANFTPEMQIKKIFIISDMQFDSATQSNSKTNFDVIKKKYEDAGFKKPKIVFWNVNAKAETVQVKSDESDTFLVSGCSPNILKTALTSDPESFMMEVLNKERYKDIK